MKRYKMILAAPALAALCSDVALADKPPRGCYTPERGFATSVCTDLECIAQAGIYRLVLGNVDAGAPLDEQQIVLRGTFEGVRDVEQSTQTQAVLNHELQEFNYGGRIFTGPDLGYVTGVDGSTVTVVETLRVAMGRGSMSGIEADGEIVLRGTLRTDTGINTFSVEPGLGGICFTK
jgi:hypothetical protein